MRRARPSLIAVFPDGHECQYVLADDVVNLGRESANELVLRSAGVSRRHARLRIEDGTGFLSDLGSTNGTFLNSTQIDAAEVMVRHCDQIGIGDVKVLFFAPLYNEDREANEPQDDLTQAVTQLAGTGDVGSLHTLLSENSSASATEIAESALLQIVVSERKPRLIYRESGFTKDVLLDGDSYLIGRDSDCDIRLRDPKASGKHALIKHTTDLRYVIRDCGSRNGIFINGIQSREHWLKDGDAVRIGDVSLTYADQSAVSTQKGSRRRPVVLVPGFAGSELWLGNEMLWPNTRRLIASSENQLLQDWKQDLRVGRAIREVAVIPGLSSTDSFGWLVDFLREELGYEDGVDLLEASYDWRQDIVDSAAQLASTIESWRASRSDPTERIVLLTHSMGGLVAKHYMADRGVDGVERCLFLGTPHLGSVTSLVTIIAGGGVLPFGITLRKVHRLAMEFTSLYQLLPVDERAWMEDGRPFLPLDEPADWLPEQFRDKLDSARRSRESFSKGANVGVPTTCIFGYGQKTLDGVRLQTAENGSLKIVEEIFALSGDGVVPESSAISEGSEIQPVRQQHGALFSDADVLRRLRYELVERDR